MGGGDTGYTIAFHSGETINIRNGKDGKDGTDGKSPDLSVKEDIDGVYYWTVNGNFLTDAAGNKMPVTGPKGEKGDKGDQGDKGDIGDKGETGAQGEKGQTGETGAQGESGTNGNHAIAPQLRISDSNIWQISTDDGKTWKDMTDSHGNPVKATGEKGAQGENGVPGKDGDSFFAKDNPVVVSDNYVTFTLKDGTTTFTVPRTNGISINFGSDIIKYQGSQCTFEVNINNLTADNYQAIYAEIKNSDGHATSIITRASSPQITATLSPDYKTVKIDISNLSEESNGSILKLTVVTNDNMEISSSVLLQRAPDYTIKTKEDWINLIKDFKFRYGTHNIITDKDETVNPDLSDLPIISLEADIDFGGETIEPLGLVADHWDSTTKYFKGIFNGNGHTLSNFTINQGGEAGLFARVGYYDRKVSIIRDLIIDNANVTGIGNVGIVSPYLSFCNVNNVTIRNSQATVTYNGGRLAIGCISGHAGDSEISNCKFSNCILNYNSNNIKSDDRFSGYGEIYGNSWDGVGTGSVSVKNTPKDGVTLNDTKGK